MVWHCTEVSSLSKACLPRLHFQISRNFPTWKWQPYLELPIDYLLHVRSLILTSMLHSKNLLCSDHMSSVHVRGHPAPDILKIWPPICAVLRRGFLSQKQKQTNSCLHDSSEAILFSCNTFFFISHPDAIANVPNSSCWYRRPPPWWLSQLLCRRFCFHLFGCFFLINDIIFADTSHQAWITRKPSVKERSQPQVKKRSRH